MSNKVNVTQQQDHIQVKFTALGSASYLLIEGSDAKQHQPLIKLLLKEIQRFEHKFSRYLPNSVCSEINSANGQAVKIDEETYNLFKYANELYEISDGLFDITSGVLEQVWQFDNKAAEPKQQDIDALLPLIGWDKVKLDQQSISLPKRMKIDFGGIAKEYAVSHIAQLAKQKLPQLSVLINLGDDIEISQARADGKKWQINILKQDKTLQTIQLNKGAMATSSDLERFVLINNQRYSHILNPKTGWPIKQSASSVTVTARTCIQAGSIATLALLQGDNAETFLSTQKDIKYLIF